MKTPRTPRSRDAALPRPFGLVLAGGVASRMQGEKATRRLRGQTLLQRALAALNPVCGALAVSTGTRELKLPRGIKALPDLKPYVMQGPLSGLYAGLIAARAADAEVMLVLACDLPNLPTALLELLSRKLRGYSVAFCEHGGQPEPLVCALRVVPMLQAVQASLEKGALKVVPLWKAAKCRLLTDKDLTEFTPLARTFANINTLDDLANELRPSSRGADIPVRGRGASAATTRPGKPGRAAKNGRATEL